MSFVLAGEVTIDGKTAKAEVEKLERAQDKLKKSSTRMSAEGKKAATSNRKMGAAAKKASADYQRLSISEQKAAQEALTMGRANRVAAGQVNQLTGEFNDAMAMMAAGQNPMQVVAEKGRSISRAVGTQGAAGAVGTLKSAFLALIGPANLAALAGIALVAAAAAMAKWMTSTGGKAETLADVLDALSGNVDDYVEAAQRARADDADLAELFGSASDAGRELSKNMVEINRSLALDELRAAAKALTEEFGGLSREVLVTPGGSGWLSRPGGVMREIEDTMGNLRNEFGLTIQDAASLVLALEGINNVATPEDAVRQAEQFSTVLLQIFGTTQEIPGSLKAAAQAADQLAISSGKMLAQDQSQAAANRERSKAAVLFFQEVLRGRAKQQAAAESALATLKEENALRRAIQTFGERSIEVAELRAEAERRAFEEKLATLGASETLTEELRAAFAQKQALAGLDITSDISAAADAAARLAGNLATARGARTDALVGGNLDFFDPRGEAGVSGIIFRPRPNPRTRPDGARGGTAGRGGAGGGVDRQAQALERLIKQQQLQLDLMRESDPVLREMLRYREAMSGATDKERAVLEKLISTRIREEEAISRVGEKQALFADAAGDAFRGMIFQGEKFSDVMKNIGLSIADAVFQASLLGTGPLARLFGGSGGGGLLGIIGDAIFGGVPAAAQGGYLVGPGSGTSDDILMWGSNGEFMVNAAATARHRGLLESINSGATVPGFAAGGIIAAPPVRAAPGLPRAGAPDPTPPVAIVRISASAEFEVQIEETAERVSVEVVEQYDRDIIPGTVKRVLEQPRRVG